MTFHVVCHDCDFEDLWGTELEAEDDVATASTASRGRP